MLDGKGNLLMANKAIQNRANEVFEERLSSNQINDKLKDLKRTHISFVRQDSGCARDIKLNHETWMSSKIS